MNNMFEKQQEGSVTGAEKKGGREVREEVREGSYYVGSRRLPLRTQAFASNQMGSHLWMVLSVT